MSDEFGSLGSGAEHRPGKDERTWAMICHLSAFTGFFTGGLGSLLAPVVIWLLKKDDMPFVDDQGKEAVNFQISILVGALIGVAMVLTMVLAPLAILWFVVLAIADIVFVLIAAIRANEGERYRYPFALRLLK